MEEMVKLFLPSFFSTLYTLNSLTIILLRRKFFFNYLEVSKIIPIFAV